MRSTARASTIAVALLLAGCGDDGTGPSDPIALEGSDDAAGTDGAGDAGVGGTDDGPGADDTDAGSAAGPIEAGRAAPGTWQVGDAGTVTFSLTDGRLDLDDVAPAAGWQVAEQEVDDDEIDVDLVRGAATYEFRVELEDDGATLAITIEHEVEGAEARSVELGDAGRVTVAIDGDRLVVEDLTVADGWQLTTEDVGEDDLEIELVADQQRWELEIDLDDGRLEVRRDHRIRGPVPR